MKKTIHRRLEDLEGPVVEIGEGWGEMSSMRPMTRAAVRKMVLAVVKRGSTIPVVRSVPMVPVVRSAPPALDAPDEDG